MLITFSTLSFIASIISPGSPSTGLFRPEPNMQSTITALFLIGLISSPLLITLGLTPEFTSRCLLMLKSSLSLLPELIMFTLTL